MALPFILHREVRALEAINKMMTCVIEVTFTQTDASSLVDVSTVTSVAIQRRKFGSTTWEEIYSTAITSSTELDFTLVDLATRSHVTYEYRVVLSNGTTNYISSTATVTADFTGILVANEYNSYVCMGNPKYTSQREHAMVYVKPYNSRYPHSIKNSLSNYTAGTVDGYFNPMDENCQLQMVYSDFSDGLIDFLTDGIPKIIKTPDGHMWYAQIDPQIKFGNDGVVGLCKIGFSWTEIGETPYLVYMN